MVNAESEKAVRYLQQLDDARCAGRWKDVPELCRKVDKHAPHRATLTLTARSEAQVAAYNAQRPSTATSTAPSSLSQLIPTLLTAVEQSGGSGQDAFQATVCLGWLHYVLDEPGLAVARLPQDFGAVAATLGSDATPLSAWSKVCLVKGTYLKGSALERTGAIGDAVTTYSSIISWLSTTSPGTTNVQFTMWSEHLLVRLCQLSDQSAHTSHLVDSSTALKTFRYWDKFWEGSSRSGGSEAANAPRYRRLAWKAYYDTLSAILRFDLPYEHETVPADQEKTALHSQSSIRLRQRAELKRVETVYESLLIKETQFPKASESNREIEGWVDSVIDNWRLFCGPTWNDNDLGEGGKEGVARSVLDILYRAATKTFHSTQILRYLFVVHASLAEFDLAFKAYDSYVEIITRGKDRAEKTGEIDAGVDDDSTVLRTSAEAIRLLCRFGSRKEAEQALEIGINIEKWLEQADHIRTASETGSIASTETQVESTALAGAYCAIGISHANWARFTYQVETRAESQAKAVQYLRRSIAPSLGSSNNIEALYALALVLAETRDIAGAIKVVKRALSPANKTTNISADGLLSTGPTSVYGRERKLIPLWHLLALLLTSRSEYDAAEKACEAAFEQFGDPTVLFGADDVNSYRSEHLNEASGRVVAGEGIVDRMETFEKTSVIQIKMTQLALLEVTDGASAAVDGGDELLALYSRLFGDPGEENIKPAPPVVALAPPKSSAGTLRGSIFRGRGSVRAFSKEDPARNSSILGSKASPTAAQPGPPPAIQVTDNDNTKHTNGHHHHLLHHHKTEDTKVGVARTPSKLRKRSASLGRASISDPNQTPEVPPLPENVHNGTSTQGTVVSLSNTPRKSVESGDRALRSIPHNMSNASPPIGHADQPPKQDVRLPAPVPHADFIAPDPQFSKLQQRRQKVSLLISVWIFIAGLYTRAQMYEDARDAIAEALKLVESFEVEVLAESITSSALAAAGWGGGKSAEELWADVFTARGELSVTKGSKHLARTDFERALLHFPDHPASIVGLSDILLDIYNESIPLEPLDQATATPHSSPPLISSKSPAQPHSQPTASKTKYLTSHTPSAENQLSPPELNRLAARDRAFGLLSTLTKLGAGWDYAEAWYALARAYEESGQVEKTKEVLWWCVELEDTRPVRKWGCLGAGGYVL